MVHAFVSWPMDVHVCEYVNILQKDIDKRKHSPVSRSISSIVKIFSSINRSIVSAEGSALRGEVVLRKRRGRAHRGRPFGGNRTSIAAPSSSFASGIGLGGTGSRSRKCRSLILDEMLERSLFADKRDDSFSG